MTIKEIRQLTGLSAQKFGDKYGIPLRTIQNWEGGQRQAPEYIVKLLERVVKEDMEDNGMNEIAILMADRCSEKEAKRYLEKGTMIWDNFDEYIQSLKDSGCYEGETIEDIRAGKVTDRSAVIYQGKEYIIEYVN